jgi:hypothetical protein
MVRLLRTTSTVLFAEITRCRSGPRGMLESTEKYHRKCIGFCRFCIPHAGKYSGSAEEFISATMQGIWWKRNNKIRENEDRNVTVVLRREADIVQTSELVAVPLQ